MSRIKDAFKNGKAVIPFITGGDPSMEVTEELIYAMAEAGADLIEVGVPFSDPVAEGVVVQAANERALSAGGTTDQLFELVAKVRGRVEIPLVFLTYMNPIYTYGKEAFLRRCQESGLDGLVVPDLPFEEKEEILPECERFGVDLISLIAPTSHERITMIAKEAKGFLCCVSSMDITDVRNEVETDIREMVRLARTVSGIPCAVGFEISAPEQAKAMASLSDGAIVGSAIVELVEKYGKDSIGPVAEYVRAMKEAVQSVSIF